MKPEKPASSWLTRRLVDFKRGRARVGACSGAATLVGTSSVEDTLVSRADPDAVASGAGG